MRTAVKGVIYPLVVRSTQILDLLTSPRLPLNRAGRWMISQPVSPICVCSPLSFRTWPVYVLMLSSSPFHCALLPCKMILVRRYEWETCPYHCSLRLFLMVRRSSCGPIACWILVSLYSIWSLYEMQSIVSSGSTSFPWLVFFFEALL